MLTDLSIRDIVLIDRLDFALTPGLGVLTGETGAGKSILLDALGLAIGMRAEARLVRAGADQAVVSAMFVPPLDHPVFALLAEHGIEAEDEVVLRRILSRDGRSRAHINDQPVSVALLREAGSALVEIQGQFEQQGLLNAATHRALLDAYGAHDALLREVADAHATWRKAAQDLDEAHDEADRARRDEGFLRHAVEELDRLAPEPGEEASLAAERQLLQNAGKLTDAVNEAFDRLTGPTGADDALRKAAKTLESAAAKAAGALEEAVAALDRAEIELGEALSALNRAASGLQAEDGRLEEVEERLFALRDIARKHGVAPDALLELRETLARQLSLVDAGVERLAALEKSAQQARDAYLNAANALSEARRRAAEGLDTAVMAELAPLRLDKARFRTVVSAAPETAWGPDGIDRVAFEVATNPGSEPGPLSRVASGGELSRFLLAIKVVLAGTGGPPTLVFDEVDSGVGGATASAVGERLARLAESRQILVVTHSPQVAAVGQSHWQVAKSMRDGVMITDVAALDSGSRLEEVARMLSGATVTDEARAAASRLLEGVGG